MGEPQVNKITRGSIDALNKGTCVYLEILHPGRNHVDCSLSHPMLRLVMESSTHTHEMYQGTHLIHGDEKDLTVMRYKMANGLC